jgi:uncharacterized repeat protein (TIGR01451 family)
VTVTLPPDLTVTKMNNVSNSVALGNSFDWTITVTNSGVADALFADGETILSDPLPAGATYNPILIIGGGVFSPLACAINSGTLTCIANGGAVILSEGDFFTVTVTATPTVAGSLANTATVDPNGVVTELNETNNTGSNTVTVVAPPSITKSFSPNPVFVGSTSTVTFTITNPNTSTGLMTLSTDPLPTGFKFRYAQPRSQLGGLGLTPAAGYHFTFTGGTIPETGTVQLPGRGSTRGLKGQYNKCQLSNGGTGTWPVLTDC